MICVILSFRWNKIINHTKGIICSELNDCDVVYIGESFVKCTEYIENESIDGDPYVTYHIYTMNFSRCQYMNFKYGLSNHLHLEKLIFNKGKAMKRNVDNEFTLTFDSDLNPINSNGEGDENVFLYIYN